MTVPILDRDAVISECGRYRYLLRRVWNHGRPRALVIMLNPSTADSEIDDATIRSLVRLLDAIGYGSYEVVNVFALRATDPKELAKAIDPAGPLNKRIVYAAIGRCDVVVCAWGAHPAVTSSKSNSILTEIRSRRPVYCFGKTKSGAPKHPLYIKTGAQLEAFE